MRARLTARQEAGGRVLVFAGVLDAAASGEMWGAAQREAGRGAVVLDLSALEACDTTGAVLLAELAGRPGSTVQGATPSACWPMPPTLACKRGWPRAPCWGRWRAVRWRACRRRCRRCWRRWARSARRRRRLRRRT